MTLRDANQVKMPRTLDKANPYLALSFSLLGQDKEEHLISIVMFYIVYVLLTNESLLCCTHSTIYVKVLCFILRERSNMGVLYLLQFEL